MKIDHKFVKIFQLNIQTLNIIHHVLIGLRMEKEKESVADVESVV